MILSYKRHRDKLTDRQTDGRTDGVKCVMQPPRMDVAWE